MHLWHEYIIAVSRLDYHSERQESIVYLHKNLKGLLGIKDRLAIKYHNALFAENFHRVLAALITLTVHDLLQEILHY